MSDALPRNITLIGRLKKEWSRISRDIYSESYTSRQEIVPLDESTQAGVKEKPPLPGALISNGAAYRIPRIRCADPHRLRPPAGALARGLKRSAFSSRPRLDRGSNPCSVYVKEKPTLPGALISNGAAYRIRTYDVLIRSQTLYPAEVTPQRTDYYARDPSMGQATIWKNFTK